MLTRKRKKRVIEEKITPVKKKKSIIKFKRIKREESAPKGKEQRQKEAVTPFVREDRSKIDYKKRARRNKRRRRVILGIFILTILLCVMFFAPFFGIARIEVKGISRMSQEQVITASGIMMGENIFALKMNDVKRRIEALPYTSVAKVKRGFPNVMKLTVEESKPFAYISYNENQFILVDEFGKMLEITDALPQQHFIQLLTQKIENPVLGQTFSEENTSYFKKYLATVSEIVHNNIVEKISLIDVSIDYELNVRYNQLEVKFGDTEKLEYKFTNLLAILNQLGEKAKGRLDLSVPGKSVYKETIE